MNHLRILGTRGIPAAHGGFETFAEYLALHMLEEGWRVTVYCQTERANKRRVRETEWRGVRLVKISPKFDGAIGTIEFDYKAILHASKEKGVCLTLGYNTAVFTLLLRLKKLSNAINMDGLEWMRKKWRWYEKFWLRINECAACALGDQLIADHPEIARHLEKKAPSSKIAMIPYGARYINDFDIDALVEYGLTANTYALLVARPEPENSILEIVRAFSGRKRGINLVVLGKYLKANSYHRHVLDSASEEVLFLGPIYDRQILDALRANALFYCHGHTVGGTNPSLVEALGSGRPILAHDNKFNTWVAGNAAIYFSSEQDCSEKILRLIEDYATTNELAQAAKRRFEEEFQWHSILSQYQLLIEGLA